MADSAPPAGRDRSPSPLGALDDVVDLEGAPTATGLAPPAGAPEHHPADRRPLLEGGCGAAGGARAASLDPAARGCADAHARPERPPQRRSQLCPRGQKLCLRIAVRFVPLPMWANGLVERDRVAGRASPSARL